MCGRVWDTYTGAHARRPETLMTTCDTSLTLYTLITAYKRAQKPKRARLGLEHGLEAGPCTVVQ